MAHYVQQIELLTLVSEQLRDLTTVLLHDMFVKFGPRALVNQVLVHIDEVTMLVDSSAELVEEETLLVSLEVLHDLLTGLRVTVEVPSHIVTIEVVAL